MHPLLNPLRRHRRLLIDLGDNNYRLLIDNTTFTADTTCPRQTEFGSLFGRTRGESAALVYGGAMHAALEADLLGKPYSDCIHEMSSHFADAAMHYSLDEWRTLEHCTEGFRQYLLYYENARFKPITINDKPAVELGFHHPILTLDLGVMIPYPKSLLVKGSSDTNSSFFIAKLEICWSGKIDAIVERHDGIFVVDHKTTSMIGSSFWDDFLLSSQMTGYTWAGRQTGLPIKGIIIDAIVGRKPTKTGVAHEFARQTFNYTEDQVAEWRRNTEAHLTTFTTRLVEGFFPMQTAWCMGKYGKCRYHDVCIQPEATRLHMLMSPMYVDNVWDPLNHAKPEPKITKAIPALPWLEGKSALETFPQADPSDPDSIDLTKF